MTTTISILNIKNANSKTLNLFQKNTQKLIEAGLFLCESNKFCVFSLTSNQNNWLIFFGQAFKQYYA